MKNETVDLNYKYVDINGKAYYTDSKLVNVDEHIEKERKNTISTANVQRQEPYFSLIVDFQQNILTKYDVSDSEAGKILMLCTYARYINHASENMYIKNKGKFAKNKDLSEILLINNSQVRYFKHNMVKKGILHEDKTGIYIDKEVMIRGRKMDNSNSYKVFSKPVRSLYYTTVIENKPKTSQNVGLFFQMIPFIQKKDNHLVLSEYNKEADTYEYLSHKELAEKLGMNKPNLVKRIGQLNEAFRSTTGMYLIYELQPTGIEEDSTNKKEFRLVVNPNITFSSHDGNKRALDDELSGNNDSSTEELPRVEKKYKILLNTYSGITYYMQTDKRYTRNDINKILENIKFNSYIVFYNTKINANDISGVHFETPKSLKNIRLNIEVIPTNKLDDATQFKELQFI